MDDYGAPRYPELVLAVKRSTLQKRGELVDSMLEAIERGTFKALQDRDATVKKLVDASGADEPLVRAQLAAVSRALLPPISLDRAALDGLGRVREAVRDPERGARHRAHVPAPLASPA